MSSDDESIGPLPSTGINEKVGSKKAKNTEIGLRRKRKHRKFEFESTYLTNLPSSDTYECSYMHRDVVTHVVVSKPCDFVITASLDGQVKFWKKVAKGIEFVKHFQVRSPFSARLLIFATSFYFLFSLQ